tara:strand:+ start:2428 stop:3132 length:705 start_codon:yes stop_codon:yes gene_type:complete
MSYSIQECCQLFKIRDLSLCDERNLRKKYHRLCLKYHPDKNPQHSKEVDFLKVQQCYEILLKQKNICESSSEEEYEDSNFMETLLSFLDKDSLNLLYNLLQRCKKQEIIYLHVSWEQVCARDVYVYKNKYIPLWHSVVHDECMYYIKVKDMPNHIRRLSNNDLVVIQKYALKPFHLQRKITITLSPKRQLSFICDTKDIKDGSHVCLHQGIPRPNEEDKFDVSQLSHVILFFMD